jgi:hypothetical protein
MLHSEAQIWSKDAQHLDTASRCQVLDPLFLVRQTFYLKTVEEKNIMQ